MTSIFDIHLVLSFFFFGSTFWKFLCNRRRHWARETFLWGGQPRVCSRRVSEIQKRKEKPALTLQPFAILPNRYLLQIDRNITGAAISAISDHDLTGKSPPVFRRM